VLLGVGLPLPNLSPDVICKGCLSAGRDRNEPQPLVVVLHGDEGSPAKVAGLWAPLAERGVCSLPDGSAHVCDEKEDLVKRRTFWLFAPKCPSSRGCAGSYWRWGGSVSWLDEQVDLFAAKHSVDSARVYVAGWSGGATYISMMNPDWFPRFAALSLAGGGTHPHKDACLPNAGGSCAPVTYLMGSGNPLFVLAENAKRGFERCGHELDFQLLPGVDHAGEWRAYQKRLPEIASWLLDHPQGCPAPEAAPRPDITPPAASASATTSSEQTQQTGGVPPAVEPARGGCACSVERTSSPVASAGGLLLLASVLRFFRSGARRVERRLAESRRTRPRRA